MKANRKERLQRVKRASRANVFMRPTYKHRLALRLRRVVETLALQGR
jgi:hypothetical protein